MRTFAKRVAERLLTTRVLRSLVTRVPADGLLVLAYHNIVRESTQAWAEPSLHLAYDDFVEQLEILADETEIVDLEGPDDVRVHKPRVAITFDDAYGGAVRHALPLLASRGWPATMFVAPGVLGGHAFWWDAVGGPDEAALPDGFRRYALEGCGGRQDLVMAAAAAAGLRLIDPPVDARTASVSELERAVSANPRLRLAAHTWNHVSLSDVPDAEASEEMRRSLEWVESLGKHGLRKLAYPYGRYSNGVVEGASRLGVTAAYRVDGGWHRPAVAAPLAIPRLNVPAGVSAAGFILRIRGTLR